MFASLVPPANPYAPPDSSLPPSTSSRHHLPSLSALSTAARGQAADQLTLHDQSTRDQQQQPQASTSANSSVPSATSDKGAKSKGGPRKRGRKRIDEPLDDIKGNDSLDLDAKRKLQNRAAQRAFRERKEKHLADLEERVVAQEQQLNEFREVLRSLMTENDALRRGEHPPRTAFSPSLLVASTHSLGSPTPEAPVAAVSTVHPPRDVSPIEYKPSYRVSPPAASASHATFLKNPLVSNALPPPESIETGAGAHSGEVSIEVAVSPRIDLALPPPPPQSSDFPNPLPLPRATYSNPPPLLPLDDSSLPLNLADFTSMDFDFDAPFDFDSTLSLPPLFSTLTEDPSLLLTFSQSQSHPQPTSFTTSATATLHESDDACPGEEDDPVPLPNGRIPCDKPECDFTAVSCALPIPWRPAAVGNGVEDKNLWVAQKAWAKLYSHPLFDRCSSDDLCQLLRDKTRCSDDGRLVVHKSDVCDIFRSIPARVRAREEAREMN